MGAGHDHSAGIQTATTRHRRRLYAVLAIYATIITAELIGAWLSGSVALIAEAMHMAVDGSGIVIALIATFLAARKASSKRSFGWMRAEIVAVLINVLLLFTLGTFVLIKAVDRWFNPEEIEGGLVIAFAAVGVIGTTISLLLLAQGAKESLNVKAAMLEVMSDAIGATAIIVSAIIYLTTGWVQGDAIAAALIGVIILPRAFLLGRQAINIIMQGVPNGIEIDEVEKAITSTDGVAGVHSLHVWALTSGVPVMSAHVLLSDETAIPAIVLDDLTNTMREQFHIEHVTIQIEEFGHLEHEGAMHRDLAGLTSAPAVSGGQHVGHSH